MPRVPSRELRNHIAEVLRQVADGARVTVTVNGAAVAEISPVRETRPAFISKRDLIALLAHRRLNSHKYQSLTGPNGEDVWESYIENRTPGAWRIWWLYGPTPDTLTILTLGPHP